MSIIIGSIGGFLIALGASLGGIYIDQKEFWIILLGMAIYGIAQHI